MSSRAAIIFQDGVKLEAVVGRAREIRNAHIVEQRSEFIRNRNFRKEDRVKEIPASRGAQAGLVCIFSAVGQYPEPHLQAMPQQADQ